MLNIRNVFEDISLNKSGTTSKNHINFTVFVKFDW